MPMNRIQFLAVIGSLFLILLILELIRRNYLKEKYSLLWLSTGGVFLVLSFTLKYLEPITRLLGFQMVSNALLLAGIIFLIIIALGTTITISRLSEKNQRLTQEMAFLKKRIEDLEKEEGETLSK